MDEARALEALQTILARPEFAPRRYVNPWRAFWEAVQTLLLDFLRWVFSPVRDVVGGHVGWVQLAVVAVAAVALLAGIVVVVRAIGLAMVRDAAAGTRAAALRRERSDRLWREAHQLAAAGRLREATRALYLSALFALEEHDVLHVEAALTNREHADRLARARPAASDSFATVVQRYDRVRYGNYPVSADSFAELSGLVARARAMAA
jgi:hypothetical protein